MPRTQDLTKRAPMDSGHWGEYSSTSVLPNTAAGQAVGTFLNRGDLASVDGVLYQCTLATQGSATWSAVVHVASSQTQAFTGATSFPIGTYSGAHNWQAIAETSGTDTTPANNTQFVTSIFLPANMTLTGASYLIGSVGGTDRVYAVLYSSAGAVLANSTLGSGGTVVGTAANVQQLAFTATYAALGPRMYYVGISMNGNTARLRTVPVHTQGSLWGNSVSQTHATVAAITPPTTFTDAKLPIVSLY
jgi:hypothetical protein